MFSGCIFILLGIVSVVGGIIYFIKNHPMSVYHHGILIFFMGSHLLLVGVGIGMLFGLYWLSYEVLILPIVLLSRFLNGKVILGKVHWHHYLIVTLVLVGGFALYPY